MFTHTIDINLAKFESKLRKEIGSDLNALQITYDAISKGNKHENKIFTLSQGITVATILLPPVDFLLQREINKCFKSIMGSVQDYLDNLIAILQLKEDINSLKLPSKTTKHDIDEILREKFEECLLSVSTNQSLKTPHKLDRLLDNPEHQIHKESLQSYFDVRNGLEHHKGIAKAPRKIRYKRIGLASTEGNEISEPGQIGEGEGLVLKTFDEEICYDKGGILLITKSQLESIALNLLITIIPRIQLNLGEKFNAKDFNNSGKEKG
jgi:hypothetical protein